MTADTTMVHVKVPKKLKNEAQQVARRLGVSLSLVAEQAFRDFAAAQKLVVMEPEVPNKRLQKILREAQANLNNPKYWSPGFTSAEDAIAYLRKQTKG
ncbi:hypothetical protein HY968_00135 [Candidatus Kaiserbacteria bacterium]|nr:hypothetical protein [Candidatus Kaiserbacteria bacterium]